MLQTQIVIGGVYLAKVSNKLTQVRVDDIRLIANWSKRTIGRQNCATCKIYDVTNLATGRKTVFRSAAKFSPIN